MTEREKPRPEWSVAEILHYGRTGEAPENEDYKEARAAALEDAGVEPRPEDLPAPPVEEQTTEDALRRIREEKTT